MDLHHKADKGDDFTNEELATALRAEGIFQLIDDNDLDALAQALNEIPADERKELYDIIYAHLIIGAEGRARAAGWAAFEREYQKFLETYRGPDDNSSKDA